MQAQVLWRWVFTEIGIILVVPGRFTAVNESRLGRILARAKRFLTLVKYGFGSVWECVKCVRIHR